MTQLQAMGFSGFGVSVINKISGLGFYRLNLSRIDDKTRASAGGGSPACAARAAERALGDAEGRPAPWRKHGADRADGVLGFRACLIRYRILCSVEGLGFNGL